MTAVEAKKKLAALLEYYEQAAGVTIPLEQPGIVMKFFPGGEGLRMFAQGYAIDCIFSNFVAKRGKSESAEVSFSDWQILTGVVREFFDQAQNVAIIEAVKEEIGQTKEIFLAAVERLASER